LAFHQARRAKEEMDETERRAIAMQEAEEALALQGAEFAAPVTDVPGEDGGAA
jgi:DNA-directed RNA polymerase subunit beta'